MKADKQVKEYKATGPYPNKRCSLCREDHRLDYTEPDCSNCEENRRQELLEKFAKSIDLKRREV